MGGGGGEMKVVGRGGEEALKPSWKGFRYTFQCQAILTSLASEMGDEPRYCTHFVS